MSFSKKVISLIVKNMVRKAVDEKPCMKKCHVEEKDLQSGAKGVFFI